MSIYLQEIPETVKFKNSDQSLVIDFRTDTTLHCLFINEVVSVEVNHIDWLIDCLKSIKNISEEYKKTQQ